MTPEYCRLMARYNAWQNKAIWDVIETMSGEEAGRDRGAFFGSIHGTLNHLLWADQMWMSRFDNRPAPELPLAKSAQFTPTLAVWWAERFRTDAHIRQWAEDLDAVDLVGDLNWYSSSLRREVHHSVSLLVAHFFNHQTHHRGQVHAMLTGAGLSPDDTDLFLLSEETQWS